MLANKDIREEIDMRRLRHWEVAAAMGVSPETFSRRLRQELSSSQKEKIRHIMDNLTKGNN